ncbi:MAG: hypothetical protein IJ802_00085, partial [Kiritimatiellae bacterium]|nr:hypothetical protein [Kiritimatiellia bacterium]
KSSAGETPRPNSTRALHLCASALSVFEKSRHSFFSVPGICFPLILLAQMKIRDKGVWQRGLRGGGKNGKIEPCKRLRTK